jgi:hypothetical protein
VALWLVIDPCVNFVDVCIVIFGIYIFLIPQFFETPDDGYSPKVQFVQAGVLFMKISATFHIRDTEDLQIR